MSLLCVIRNNRHVLNIKSDVNKLLSLYLGWFKLNTSIKLKNSFSILAYYKREKFRQNNLLG